MQFLAICERLRRLPEPRWQQPPREPLGSLAPDARATPGEATLEDLVRAAITRLMAADARARAVQPIAVDVGVFALPDVLAALARSIRDGANAEALAVLEDVTRAARAW